VGKRKLLYTNILLGYIGNSLPANGLQFITKTIESDFNISIINKIEVLGHPSSNQSLEDFLNLANIFELSHDIVNQTILIRKSNKIKLPDAIIAATALAYDLVLVTRNTDDFKNIDGLEVINPFDL